ncbi:MAG: glycoside hydrolase family 2 protein [Bacteroidales bacterium]|nr:glycoside hydrolase family 2 protein [Bacteroidales bacterium]
MNRYIAIFFLLFSILLSELVNAQDINTFELDSGWKFRRAGTKEWLPASVPGVVHLDLMRNKVIPDPYFGDNESKLQWIGEVGWEYMKNFHYDEKKFAWRHIDLVLKGLDTYANVYLNDSLILVADNMFREWYVDIKQKLHVGPNTLRIQFPAIIPENKARYDKLPNKLPGDEKVVCRKAAYHFGWDWGPELVTCGIWRPVYIREWNAVNVLGVQFIQKKLTDSAANMAAQFTLFSELDDAADIRIFLDTTEILRQEIGLNKGPNVIRGDFSIINPQRWWPNGLGNPTLYNFGYEVWFNGSLAGEGRQKIGLRTIELIQDKDSTGKSFYFNVNDIPVFIKGANYIPQDNFLPRVTDSDYRALILDVKQANMNMLRVWGGGIYENDIFYDLCDENGIMVWQDFMFANSMYPGNVEFLDGVRNEAIQNIVRLRRHPCIALWCGNNEIDEGWKNWGWQKQYGYSPEDSAAVYKTYRTIFNYILPNNVRRFDTARAYIPTSPLHGWGRPESLTEGDSHYWGVWWGKESYAAYEKKVGRFMSEYGFQSFPDYSTIKKFTSQADLSLNSAVMKAHQKHPTGFETIDEYLLRDFKKPKDFESYTYVSQLLQTRGIISAIEAHRRAKPYCMGTMYWQLNDCWPVVSWSSRDYYGKKKALHYAIPAAYDKFLISPVIDDGHIKVYISSDDKELNQAVMTVKVLDFAGNLYSDEGFMTAIPGNSSLVYYDTLQSSLLGNLDPRGLLLLVTLKGFGLSEIEVKNILYFVSPKDLELPLPLVEKVVTETPDGYNIRLSCDKLVKNLYLSTSVKGDFSDNYFDMLPGEAVDIRFTTPKKNPKMGELIVVRSLVDTY